MKDPIYEATLEKARAQMDKMNLTGNEAPNFAEARVWKPYALAFRFVTKVKKKILGRIRT